MNKELIGLRSKSFEGEVILKNFASRKRVHKDKEVQVHRLYLDMTNRGLKLSRVKFDQVFADLERLGYGITVGRDAEGKITTFLPETSIKSIGMDAMDVLRPEGASSNIVSAPTVKLSVAPAAEMRSSGLVCVVMIKDGMKWTTFVPEDQVAEVTAKMA